MAELAKKKFYRGKPRTNNQPIEVIVYDVLLQVPVIAEYRNETKVAHDGRIFKVYHPVWIDTGGARWVHRIIKKLGPFTPDAPVA